ncbi:TetR/AcrR family transcriptional regulator [Actinomadura sp. NPDC048394]|jgi:AcrR family transcriptional regulator|uniref:TetR/AcrR family transcriptional regulator n=1 Tax=Actinomadura sp. NPDC048394 TaxID=3158223 RepID=UPI0033C3DC86
MGGTEEDRLIETATRIFAELGYDGTSLQMIADAAGLGIDAVHSVAATKADLYRAVMRNADEVEEAALREALAVFTPDRSGVLMLADAYLDFYVSHPRVLALWQHRWMGDAADLPDLEELYTQPLSRDIADTVRGLVPPDVDPDYLIWSVVWCVYGFLTGGVVRSGPGEPPRRHTPSSAPCPHDDVEGFRAFLHTMLDHLFTPLPRPPA